HPYLDQAFEKPILHTDSLASYTSEKFFAFSRVMVEAKEDPVLHKQSFSGSFSIRSPLNYLPIYRELQDGQAFFVVSFFADRKEPVHIRVPFSLKDVDTVSQQLSINVPVSLEPDNYIARIGISTSIPGCYSLNSTSYEFDVK
ncbi:MAG: hypothetical protein ACTHMC_28810, partial [Pseudobacter sp.]|uniref:hypothetical protein n=1 Tax=Pseudobacter sp. TaxID=2045420 RepID=UPI003F7E10EE